MLIPIYDLSQDVETQIWTHAETFSACWCSFLNFPDMLRPNLEPMLRLLQNVANWFQIPVDFLEHWDSVLSPSGSFLAILSSSFDFWTYAESFSACWYLFVNFLGMPRPSFEPLPKLSDSTLMIYWDLLIISRPILQALLKLSWPVEPQFLVFPHINIKFWTLVEFSKMEFWCGYFGILFCLGTVLVTFLKIGLICFSKTSGHPAPLGYVLPT